jgi:hypothetical protein
MQLKPKFVERQFSITADVYFGLYALIVSFILSVLTNLVFGAGTGGDSTGVIFFGGGLAGLLVIALFVWRHIYIASLIKTHDATLETLATQNAGQWTFEPAPPVPPEFRASSLLDLAKRDLGCANYIKTAGWSYMDLTYSIYQETRSGEYKQATIYYAVMAVELPRVLPNVLFDSKLDRRRQFKAVFAADQRHELEGDFNNYFDTYFAEGYTVDSLSFITPDVMQAMIAADDYDIEIVGNHLLLYGPVLEAAAQLQEMSQKLVAIKQALQVTAADYRDDRLPAAMAAQTVTAQGMFLKQRKVRLTVGTIVIIIYVIVRLALIFVSPQ